MNIDLDSYFARAEERDAAMQAPCESCGAGFGERCTDRWGITTSLVHHGRGGWVDNPYAMHR